MATKKYLSPKEPVQKSTSGLRGKRGDYLSGGNSLGSKEAPVASRGGMGMPAMPDDMRPPTSGGLPPGLAGTMGGSGSGPGGLGTAYLGEPGGMPRGISGGVSRMPDDMRPPPSGGGAPPALSPDALSGMSPEMRQRYTRQATVAPSGAQRYQQAKNQSAATGPEGRTLTPEKLARRAEREAGAARAQARQQAADQRAAARANRPSNQAPAQPQLPPVSEMPLMQRKLLGLEPPAEKSGMEKALFGGGEAPVEQYDLYGDVIPQQPQIGNAAGLGYQNPGASTPLSAEQNQAIYDAFAQHANNPQLIHQLAQANNVTYDQIAGALGQPVSTVQQYFGQAGLSLGPQATPATTPTAPAAPAPAPAAGIASLPTQAPAPAAPAPAPAPGTSTTPAPTAPTTAAAPAPAPAPTPAGTPNMGLPTTPKPGVSTFKYGGMTTSYTNRVGTAAKADMSRAGGENKQRGVGLATKGLGKFKVR